MKVSLTGVSLHVADIERSKAFYLSIPGAVVEHEAPGRFVSIRIGDGRVNLVKLGSGTFHVEIGASDLDALREELHKVGIHEQGPQPQQWGQQGMITKDPDGNFIEFDDHL